MQQNIYFLKESTFLESIYLLEFIPIYNEAVQYLLYAGLMLVDVAILAFLAIRYYEYENYSDDEDLKYIEINALELNSKTA